MHELQSTFGLSHQYLNWLVCGVYKVEACRRTRWRVYCEVSSQVPSNCWYITRHVTLPIYFKPSRTTLALVKAFPSHLRPSQIPHSSPKTPQASCPNNQPLDLKYTVLRLCAKMITASGIRYIRRANKKRQEKMDAEQAQKGHSYSNQGSAQYGQGQSGQSYSNQGSVQYG